MRPFCAPCVRMTVKLSNVHSEGSTRRDSPCSVRSDCRLPSTTATIGNSRKAMTSALARCSRMRARLPGCMASRDPAVDELDVADGEHADQQCEHVGGG